MKKSEILKLIEANKKIIKNSELLSITRDKVVKSLLIDKEFWFPDIDELKEEFDVLREEVQSALDETISCKKYIQSSGCKHEVRLKYFGLFGGDSRCIFCDEIIAPNNCTSFEYSINRNKYCVDLIAKYQDDEDYNDVIDGYTDEDVYEIIIDILKDKENDEEIDLVQEFKKLNLKKCKINEDKKVTENYILIIGGSNKQFVDDESYLYKKGLRVGIDFVKYFSSLLNTKVELIDNSETLESDDLKALTEDNYNIKLTNYNTTEELDKVLLKQRNIPFKIIIDLTELYEYKVSDDAITKESVTLKLDEYFPHSHIIRIGNLSRMSLEELSNFLRNIQNPSDLYAYHGNKYYCLEEDEIKSDNLENTCGKFKRLLRK